MPRRDITVERAAVCDRPEIAAVHVDIREIEALGGLPVAVEPDPGLARRNWRRRGWDLGRRRWVGAAAAISISPLGHSSHFRGRGAEALIIAVLLIFRAHRRRENHRTLAISCDGGYVSGGCSIKPNEPRATVGRGPDWEGCCTRCS